jgi:phosphoglycolate phosphatase
MPPVSPTDFRTCLFDLDGTLIDHFRAIHRCHAYTLRQLGLPEPTLAQVRRAVGLGVEHAIAQLLGPDHADLLPRALPIYRAHWEKTMLDDVELLPGARELLSALKQRGRQTAVFTNKHGPSAREICRHLGLDPYLDAVFGAFDTPWLKPDPKFAAHVLAQLKADARSTLFVGDSPYDIQAAHNAGLPVWCVTTGTHTAEELGAAGADAVYRSLDEISAVLVKIQTR